MPGGNRERGGGFSPGSRIPVPHPRPPFRLPRRTQPGRPRETPADSGRHLQFLVEPGLAAGLEVADDDPELPDVLHELLQMLLQVVELLRHGPTVRSNTAGVVLLLRFLLPSEPTPTSVSSRGGRRGLDLDPGAPWGRGGAGFI